MHRIISLLVILFFLQSADLSCQDKIIDQIIAVVGDKKVLHSDIERQYQQLVAQGVKATDNLRCQIFEELLSQKLLLSFFSHTPLVFQQ